MGRDRADRNLLQQRAGRSARDRIADSGHALAVAPATCALVAEGSTATDGGKPRIKLNSIGHGASPTNEVMMYFGTTRGQNL
jgi:hypothetical protein